MSKKPEKDKNQKKAKLSMKVTKRDIVLIIILLVIVAYYFGVQRPISKESEPLEAELSEVQSELDVASTKIMQVTKMQQELNEYETPGSGYNKTPAYDNTNDIILEMNKILGGSDKYTISFGDIETDGNIVRRPIELTFSASRYDDATNKIKSLESSPNGYLIKEMNITGGKDSSYINKDGSTKKNSKPYEVTLLMTSFEYKE